MSPFQTSKKRMMRGALACLYAASIGTLANIPPVFFAASPAVADSHQITSPSLSEKEGSALLIFNASDDPSGGFDDQGRPHRRSSGGSRGTCTKQLIALLPGSDILTLDDESCRHQSAAIPALTLTPHPILWFHIPEHQANVTAELVLLGENREAIAIQDLTLPPQAGIIAVQLDHPLERDQSYPWIFSLLETGQSPSENPTVEGSIQYVEAAPSLVTSLDNSPTPRERVVILAEHHIWHDALTALAHVYKTDPTHSEIKQDWINFLESVGLNAITESPLIDCCMNATVRP